MTYFQMRCSVTVTSQANNVPELVQYSCKLRDAEQDKMFVPHIHVCGCLHSYFSQTVFINCKQWVQICLFPLLLWGISMSLIFSCTTAMCFQMNCSVTPGCHLTRCLNIHKRLSGWSLVIRELFHSSFLRTFPSTTKMGFHTNWAAQAFWLPSDPLDVHVTHNTVAWLGFDWEDLQIVHIGHNIQYVM